jgi:hypothetical protein
LVPQDPRNMLLMLTDFNGNNLNGSTGVTVGGFVSAWVQDFNATTGALTVQLIQSVGGSGSGDSGGPSTGALQVKLIQ